jgi:hypothetical protein
MRDRLGIGGAVHGLITGAHAILAGRREQARFTEMIGQQFRLFRCKVGKTPLQRISDAFVPFAPAHQQQALIGGVAHQRMLEDEASFEAAFLGKDNSRGHKLCQHAIEFARVPRGNRLQQGKGELPADHGRDLGHIARAAEAVEPGHQRVLQRRRHRGVAG